MISLMKHTLHILHIFSIYNGNRDAVSLKRWLLTFLPSPVIAMTATDVKEQILTNKFVIPWLVDFYAPWCGHCTHFEPEFRKVAHVSRSFSFFVREKRILKKIPEVGRTN